MALSEQSLKQEILQALSELPPQRLIEVLDFALFLKERWAKMTIHPGVTESQTGLLPQALPASHLDHLTGLVTWGGDAVADVEHLYADPV